MPQRLDYNEKLEATAKWNKQHKTLLGESKNAGCYYCCKIYPASEIKEWIRSFRKKDEDADCALCPNCGIDSVLPDKVVELSDELLREMYDYWFETDAVSFQFKNGKIVDIIDENGKYDPQEFAVWRVNQLEILAEKREKRSQK